ncbi:MAG: sulfur carrier protein ThiS [Acidimicrobiales bacterium]
MTHNGVGRFTVHVNDVERSFTRPATLAELVAQWTSSPSGCAAAVNGDVVPRAEWDEREIADGDRVEIVSAQPGG